MISYTTQMKINTTYSSRKK